MKPIRIFISSVQQEFTEERKLLADYIRQDALLGQFFETFIFEKTSAKDKSAQKVYSEGVEQSDIYLGLLGSQYGYEDAEGVSPTEREYDIATAANKSRLIFIKETDSRYSKETAFIRKAEKEVVRQSFGSYDELQTAVYASLIDYLSDKEYIRRLPFDATLAFNATIDDIDSEKIRKFVHSAGVRRGFPFGEDVEPFELLTHLNLCQGERITNAALLLFGKKPQYFFPTSTVKCGQFYGTRKEKPIPSYHIYSGDVFEVIDQAVSFVLSRIDARVGTRDKARQWMLIWSYP